MQPAQASAKLRCRGAEETKGEDLDILGQLVTDHRLTPYIGWTRFWMQTPTRSLP